MSATADQRPHRPPPTSARVRPWSARAAALTHGCAQAPGAGPLRITTPSLKTKAGAPRWEELDPTFLGQCRGPQRTLAAALPSAGAFTGAAWGGERSRLTAALERLELYYGDMDAHAQAFRAALSLEEAEAATHHRSALQALEKRIAASGEGTLEAPMPCSRPRTPSTGYARGRSPLSAHSTRGTTRPEPSSSSFGSRRLRGKG